MHPSTRIVTAFVRPDGNESDFDSWPDVSGLVWQENGQTHVSDLRPSRELTPAERDRARDALAEGFHGPASYPADCDPGLD